VPASDGFVPMEKSVNFRWLEADSHGQHAYAEADGPLPRDYRKLPWRRVQRPIWPLDAETHPRLVL
jgi:microcystin degradation protein MlrC